MEVEVTVDAWIGDIVGGFKCFYALEVTTSFAIV